jgi:hypothetical protein
MKPRMRVKNEVENGIPTQVVRTLNDDMRVDFEAAGPVLEPRAMSIRIPTAGTAPSRTATAADIVELPTHYT